MTPIFSLRDVTFYYPGGQSPALDGLTLDVPAGGFLVVCGPSGCGKSTLLRQLKTALAPHGRLTGSILFEGRPLDAVGRREQAQRIGFVQQSPENQIVTDKVWHELAFGLESLGLPSGDIRRRVAEMASFFGIQSWFYRDVTQLSGGQKQLLNLASVMVMGPDVLVLDEPTSQLDPIAAGELLTAVARVNRELGTTVVLCEHRLEEALPHATQAAVMDGGRVLCAGAPAEIGRMLRQSGHAMFASMPTAMRIWAAVGAQDGDCPVTVRDGRRWLRDFAAAHPLGPLPPEKRRDYPLQPVIGAEGVWFRYDQDGPDVVRGLSLSVRRGEFVSLLGGNGTGKTTTLKLLAGLLRPQRGQCRANGRVAMLPQSPQALFVKKTVREDLCDALDAPDDGRVAQTAALCRLEGLLERHPYDLSGGEQQRAALAKTLLCRPDVLLLDEPTKGLDAAFKKTLAEILQSLLSRGVSVVMVSHDVEFCAQYAHRCALFFDGDIVTEGTPRAFFSGNSFYTTAANRIARPLLADAVTAEDVIAAAAPAAGDWGAAAPASAAATAGTPASSSAEAGVPAGMCAPSFPAAGAAAGAPPAAGAAAGSPPAGAARTRRRPPRRTALACAVVLLLIPLTLLAGLHWWGLRRYGLLSLVVLAEAMAPFFLLFEGRRPGARELVVIAVLCGLGVAGRAVFFMLPQFKPVMAIAIVAGVAFGGETGFLVGAVTMLTSNVLYGQGPWTPWQMFAMGCAGFLAGVLYRGGLLRRSRLSLCVFGALTAVFVYGAIVNFGSAVMGAAELTPGILAAYLLTGLPMDCVHAAATAIFLWFGAGPMLEKLDRIKSKYGLAG